MLKDYPNIVGDNETSGKNLYLYNQSPGETGSRGIACVAVTIIDSSGKKVTSSYWCRPSTEAYLNPIDMKDLYSLIQTVEVESDAKTSDVMVEFRMWKQGRINVDLLKGYLSTAIKHTMWDLATEFYFLTAPIACEDTLKKLVKEARVFQSSEKPPEPTYRPYDFTRFESGEEGRLHSIYCNSFKRWCDLGDRLNVPSLRIVPLTLQYRQGVDLLAPELEKLINSVTHNDLTTTFWKNKENNGHFTVDGLVTLSETIRLEKRTLRSQFEMLDDSLRKLEILENVDEIEYPKDLLFVFQDSESFDPFGTDQECTILSRHLRNWKACVSSTDGFTFCSEENNHCKFQPLLTSHSPNFSGSTRSSFSNLDTGVLFPVLVSRQRLLMATVTNSQIFYTFYNWSKESSDRLIEITKCYSFWVSARTSVVGSIFSQKSGLFYNQSMIRNSSKSLISGEVNPFTCGGIEVETLLVKPVPPRELASRVIFKRMKFSKSLTRFLEYFRSEIAAFYKNISEVWKCEAAACLKTVECQPIPNSEVVSISNRTYI